MKNYTDKQRGELGERLAAKHLKKQGYKILMKNYRCKAGEIDIIARDGDELVFAEVKTRPSDAYVRGMYAVNRTKQEHILRAAAYYLSAEKSSLQPRFDVIEVGLGPDGKLADINHIKAAFYQQGPYARY